MTTKIKQLYNSACKNEVFLQEIRNADKDEKPSRFDVDNVKIAFAAIYYGWLVGNYGINWKNYI